MDNVELFLYYEDLMVCHAWGLSETQALDYAEEWYQYGLDNDIETSAEAVSEDFGFYI